LNGDGSLVYMPNPNFNGSEIVNYQIADVDGGTATAQILITVNEVNDPPVIDPALLPGILGDPTDPRVDLIDGQEISINLKDALGDQDLDNLEFAAVGLPPGLVMDPQTGVISGKIDTSASQGGERQNGEFEVNITVTDGRGGVVEITIVMTSINPPPVAVNDAYSVDEDSVLLVNLPGVMENDGDPDGDGIQVTSATLLPENGSVTLNADGSFVYTPLPNFSGGDMFMYEIADGDGATSTALVVITVNEVNDPPVLDAAQLPQELGNGPGFSLALIDSEGVGIPLAGAFSDVDVDTLTFAASGLPPGLVIDPVSGTIIGQVSSSASQGGPGQDGIYVVTISVSDGRGGVVEMSIQIVVTNPLPVAVDDAYSVDEDAVLSLALPGVMQNDSDLDGDVIEVTNITSNPQDGTLASNADGSFIYTPDANFNGSDVFTYEIADADGGVDSAVVVITINPVNDPPVLDPALLPEIFGPGPGLLVDLIDATEISINLRDAFADPELEDLTFAAVGLPGGLVIDPQTGVISGKLDNSASAGGVNQDGRYDVLVTVTDGKGGVTNVIIEIVVGNPAPVAGEDSYSVEEESVLVIAGPGVLVNDFDPDDDVFGVTIISVPPAGGSVVLNADGGFEYTPNPNFHGIDVFFYNIEDVEGGVGEGKVTINVIDRKDPPVASNDAYVLPEDAGENLFDIKANDFDPDSTDLTPVVITDPPGGSIRIDVNNELFYTPNDDFAGTDVFTYQIVDESGQNSNTATVEVRVVAGPKNDLTDPGAPIVIFQSLDDIETILTFSNDNPRPNGVSVSDADSEILDVTLAVVNGVITVDSNPDLVFEGGLFERVRTMKMTGRIDAINATLSTLTYIPDTNYLGPDRLVIFTEDEGGPGDFPRRFDEDNDGFTILVELRALAGRSSTDVSSLLGRSLLKVVDVDLVGFDDGVLSGVEISNDPANGLQVAFLPLPGQGGQRQPTTIEMLVTYEDGTTDTLKIPVTIFEPELIIIEEIQPMVFGSENLNPQTGFFEQVIRVINNTPFDFERIKIYIKDLDSDIRPMFETSEDIIGTFFEFPVNLTFEDETTLLLEYFSKTGKAFDPPTLEMLVTGKSVDTIPDPGTIASRVETNCFVSVGANSRVDRCYVSFPSEEGKLYWIEYSDDLQTWKYAMDPVLGTGEIVIWQDSGAPKTDPLPVDSGSSRYYRVSEQATDLDL
ncbi:tandem-95 repeat protein, partial [Verrucomicrobia bacterium]|nr:tandem-95 repeat protein [Verrucomicrobiota bacterium]